MAAVRRGLGRGRPRRRPTSRRSARAMARSFTRADHDRRVDALLFAKRPSDAYRFIAMASADAPGGLSCARIAMQTNAADAEARYRRVMAPGDQRCRADDGPRALPSRAAITTVAARQLAARTHQFVHRPADVERFYEMLLHARRARPRTRAIGRRPTTSPARSTTRCRRAPTQPTSPMACATNIPASPGSPGRAALRPAWQLAGRAVAMFDRYSKRRQVAAGPDQGRILGRPRRATPPASGSRAIGLFPPRRRGPEPVLRPTRARAGRPAGPRAAAGDAATTSPPPRSAPSSPTGAWSRRCASSAQQGRASEQTLFVRALAKSLTATTRPHARARPRPADRPPGPRRCGSRGWRATRASHSSTARPIPRLPSVTGDRWSLVHGITARKARSIPMRSATPARAARCS